MKTSTLDYKKYCDDWSEYRKGYQRWKHALKRGNKSELADFFENGQLKKYVNYRPSNPEEWLNMCNSAKDYKKVLRRWKHALKKGFADAKFEDFLEGGAVKKLDRHKTTREQSNYKFNNYLASKRQLMMALATPKWVDVHEMLFIHDNCPEGQTVDHIIPITHPEVSGLNVPWNLQYLSKSENASKSNMFNGERSRSRRIEKTYNIWKDPVKKHQT